MNTKFDSQGFVGRPLLICLILILSLAVQSHGKSLLSFGPVSGETGDISQIQINLDSPDQIGGLQLDLEFEASEISILSIPDEGIATPFGGSMYGHMITPSTLRALIMPPFGQTIPSGVIAKIPVRLIANINEARRPYTIKGLDIRDGVGLKANFSFSSLVDSSIAGNDNEPLNPGQTVEITAVALDLSNQNSDLSLLINGRQVALSGAGKLSINYLFLEPGKVLVSAISRNQNESTRLDKEVLVYGDPIRTFSQWQQFWFDEEQRENIEIAGAMSDPDGDGKNNAREYIEQTHPLLSDDSRKSRPEALVIESNGEKYLGIRLPRRSESSDVELRFTSSSGLKSDSPTKDEPLIFVRPEVFGTVKMVTYRDSVPLGDSEKRFIKAVATFD